MATIITFPRRPDSKPSVRSVGARAASMVVHVMWVLTVAVWPILRWVLALDVTAQLFRTLVMVAAKGAYLDWTFIAHFLIAVAFFCFVSCYRS